MSRRPKETLAVQLFPFLAVLVCTMGSLIFLLLVTTREIRQRAVAFAAYQLAQQTEAAELPVPIAAEPEEEPVVELPPPPVIVIPPQPVHEKPKPVKLPDQSYLLALADRERDLKELATKWKLRTTQLTSDRDTKRAAIDGQKQRIGVIVEESLALKAEIDKLELQLGRVSGEAASVSIQGKDDAARALIEQQIAELKRRLKAAEAEEQDDAEKFQVVPFDPLSGTTRRPIFIECTENGIRFLPENVTITPADLTGFTPRVNPIAAGTGALVNYWNAWNLKPKNYGKETDPYVLLLVRPNGVCAYYIALKMLEPIRTQHGYELIEESTVLKLPEVDPGAKAACQAAVERLLTERENIYRAAVTSGSGGSVFGGSPRGGGTSSSNGGTGSGNGAGSRTFTEQMVDARRSESAGFTVGDVMADEARSDRNPRSWERVENFQGRNRQRSDDDSAKSTGGNGPSSSGTNSGPTDSGGTGAARKSAQGDSEPTIQRALGQTITDGSPGEVPPSGMGNRTGGRHGRHRGSGGDPLVGSGSVPEMPVGERPNKKGRQSSGSSDGSDVDADGASDDEAAQDEAGSKSGGRAKSGTDDDTSPLRNRNGTVLSGSGQHRKPKSSDSSDKQLEPEMLAGRRWGFSEPGASIGFEREVRVEVLSDKYVIAEKYSVPVEQNKQKTFEQFATVLDKHSHEWGRPPQGFFWTPRLKFLVKPDANANYEQLNSMMNRAGVASTMEFAKENTNVEFGRDRPSTTKSTSKATNSSAPGGVR